MIVQSIGAQTDSRRPARDAARSRIRQQSNAKDWVAMTSSEGGEGDGPARRAGLDLARSTELEICSNVENLEKSR